MQILHLNISNIGLSCNVLRPLSIHDFIGEKNIYLQFPKNFWGKKYKKIIQIKRNEETCQTRGGNIYIVKFLNIVDSFTQF